MNSLDMIQMTPPPLQRLSWEQAPDVASGAANCHILTIGLEDYYQVGAFNKYVQKNQWYRFDSRLETSTTRTLEILKETNTQATFFVLGWIAKYFPELVRRVADAGHEIAIKGYYHRTIQSMTPAEFEADTLLAKEAVERATGREVLGYRVADGWLKPDDLWVLDCLAKLGFAYDSSIARMGSDWANEPFRDGLHRHQNGSLWEVPISTGRQLLWRVPVVGGNYWRQLPDFLTQRAIRRWMARQTAPLVAYFHVWELDPDQPRLSIGGRLTHLRHYRNLEKMPQRVQQLLRAYRFSSVKNVLNLQPALKTYTEASHWHSSSDAMPRPPQMSPSSGDEKPRIPVSIVIPCFNEEDLLPNYLKNSLNRVEAALTVAGYAVEFVLVDDGSTDGTWEGLKEAFRDKPNYLLHQHDVNLGVSAAIVTGLRLAHAETVCSMDCDCSYDPLELLNMIPKLQPGIDMVTASPYHPEGQVRNVPAWRLTLSRGAAWLYRRVLRTKLHTYTSCFRVYRRSSVANIRLQHANFLGIAEQLGRLDLTGGVIIEHPATLEVRMFGRSKMKTLRTVLGHLGLMFKLALTRWFRSRTKQRDEVIRSVITSHLENKNVLIRDQASRPPSTEELDVRKVVVQTRSVAGKS